MSRAIKFRFWNPYQKRMMACKTLYELARNPVPTQCHDYEMQYTGLKDKNGVEIYEGDIVKWGHVEGFVEMGGVRVAVVTMSEPSCGLSFDAFYPINYRFKIGRFAYSKSTDKCMEVIGNIHQNPELLE